MDALQCHQELLREFMKPLSLEMEEIDGWEKVFHVLLIM